MEREAWCLCLRSIPRWYLKPPTMSTAGLAYGGKMWTSTPGLAIQYVSEEVAELAGKYLLPLTPTVAERVA